MELKRNDNNNQSSSSPYGSNPYSGQYDGQSSYGSQSPYANSGSYDPGSPYANMNSFDSQSPYGSQSSYSGQSPYGSTDPYSGNSPYGSTDPYAGQNPYAGSNPYSGNSPYGSSDPYGQDPYSAVNSQYSAMQGVTKSQSAFGDAVAGINAALNVNELLSKSFLYMFIALLITGITSLVVASSPALLSAVFGSGRIGFILIFVVEIAVLFACQSAIKSDNLVLSAVLFAAFAIVNGLTFSIIFLAFELSSIVTIFFMTSLMFAVLSVIGATTQKDLTSWSSFLLGGLIAVLVGSLVNLFLGNGLVDYIVTLVGVVVFTLYTVYDVNKIVKMSRMRTGISTSTLAFYGAIELYLDFINLFLKLLRLFGKRK